MFNFNKKLLMSNKLSIRESTSAIFPTMKTKIFLPNPKKEQILKKPQYLRRNSTRFNEIGIQMLSKNIYDQIFIEKNKSKTSVDIIEQSKKELSKHSMESKKEDIAEDVEFKIPPLRGGNIEEHFRLIGEEQAKPYQDLILGLLKGIPQSPENWIMQVGWTRYEPGEQPQQVPFPMEEILVFDIEESIYHSIHN